jgi:tRNA-specific 2-thiouridylase
LSAKRLKPTIPEIEGWVDREKLEGIYGRSRDRQLQMAKEYGLKDFESPGGGCLLTDENFAKKMWDFTKYDTFEKRDIPVMKYGRHLRLPDGAKLVIGRNKEENQYLQEIKNDKFLHVKTKGIPGPHSLISSNASDEDKKLAAKIILTYTKAKPQDVYDIVFEDKEIKASPFESREDIKPYSIL